MKKNVGFTDEITILLGSMRHKSNFLFIYPT